jgi:hypothetical protein
MRKENLKTFRASRSAEVGTRVMRDLKPKCARLINIGAKLEVVMARDVVEELGTYKLNSMNLILVGLV